MKAFSLTIMIATLLGLLMLTLNIVTVSIQSPSGLMNPLLHFELSLGTRDEFLASLLASLIATYFYGVVSWFDRELHQLRRDALGNPDDDVLIQPLDVRLLKNAIRAGDLSAIRRYATASAFAFADERFMTPVELAELYGRPEVVLAVRKAARTPSFFESGSIPRR